MVSQLLLAAAFVLFVLAALGVTIPRVQLGWAGLACLALAGLI